MTSVSAGRIDLIKSRADILSCVDMYISWPAIYPVNRDACIYNLYTAWRERQFIRVIRSDKILAWIYAKPMKPAHSNESSMFQQYYCSILNGYSAAVALYKLHDEMVKEAKRLRLNYAISGGRFDDTNNVMTRLLERHGWTRAGSVAVLHTGAPDCGRVATLSQRSTSVRGLTAQPGRGTLEHEEGVQQVVENIDV